MSRKYRSAFFDGSRLALSVSAAARLAGVLLDSGREASQLEQPAVYPASEITYARGAGIT
jgi:hypothetical protein